MYETGNWLGHWDQNGLGRQEMQDLVLEFKGDRLTGRGRDCVGSFTMAGEIGQDAEVRIVKQYDEAHSVVYMGQHDGEGRISGVWALSGDQGTWSIRMKGGFRKSGAPILDLEP